MSRNQFVDRFILDYGVYRSRVEVPSLRQAVIVLAKLSSVKLQVPVRCGHFAHGPSCGLRTNHRFWQAVHLRVKNRGDPRGALAGVIFSERHIWLQGIRTAFISSYNTYIFQQRIFS